MDDQSGMTEGAVAPEQVQQQNLLSQDQVNKIVAREKARAADSARRDAEERHRAEMDQMRQSQEQRNSEVPRDVDANAIYQKVQEQFNKEMQDRQLKDHMSQVANSYLSKVNSAKASYEDFDDVTKDFDPTSFPQLTYLLSGIENAGDVLYDLSKNPSKLMNMDRMAEKTPRIAQSELLKLSQSIAANKQAQSDAAGQTVSDPLDRLQPSRVAGSNGKMGIRDLRNQAWLKG